MQDVFGLTYPGKMTIADVLAGADGSAPARLSVTGGPENRPANLIARADNLRFLRAALAGELPGIGEIGGKVRLIYIDPPFSTLDEFSDKAGKKAYADKRKGAEYVEFLRRRLILAREVLAEDGSIFVHLDPKMAHYIKLVLDEVFGKSNFRNEIAWCYTGPGSPRMRQFNRKHDTIFWYSKGEKWVFNADAVRTRSEVHGGGFKGALTRAETENYERKGKIPEDWWEFAVSARFPADGVNRTGYPTEKPNKLLRRIIETASVEGDIVLDFFSG